MIFLVNKDPFATLQLQNQLKEANIHAVEIYLSVNEAEQNLYKLPEVILLDENMELGNLLYLTQSIKAYDSSIQIIWICCESSSEIKKIFKSYGVMQCLTRGDYFLERLSLTIIEARETISRSKSRQKRIEKLRQDSLDLPTEEKYLQHSSLLPIDRDRMEKASFSNSW